MSSYNITAISPLGGSGIRLYPLTLSTPKHLVPIANRAIFHAAAEGWAAQGVNDFILGVTGYDNRVQSYRFFGYGGRFSASGLPNVRFYYTNYEGRLYKEKSSADVFLWALDKYEHMIGDNDVLYINGDNLSEIDLDNFYQAHRQNGADLTIAVKSFEHDDPRLAGFGTVVFDPVSTRVSKFVEKSQDPPSRYANTAICLFNGKTMYKLIRSDHMRKIMAGLEEPGKSFDVGGHLIPCMVESGMEVAAYPLTGAWSDVGTPDSYTDTTLDILYGQYPSIRLRGYRELGDNVKVHESTRHMMGDALKKVKFDGKCIVGSNVIIGEGTRIQNSVIGDNAYIGNEVDIRGVTTLMPFARVGDRSRLTNCIVGHDTSIGQECVVSSGAVLGDDLYILDRTVIGIGQRVAKTQHRDKVENAEKAGYKIEHELKGMNAFVFTA